jgi:23S rRNA (adenine-N6)-dimethyltransferase
VVVRTRSARGASGQHFLRSSRLAADLVFDAEVAADDLIVEIGGGTGVLTRPLLRAGAAVIAIERDPVLAAALRKRFRDVEVVTGDAQAHPWPKSPFSVVANLPFARSGAILAHLLRNPGMPLRRAEVIVQWEFAAKHSAIWPATLRSIHWRAWYDVSTLRCSASRVAAGRAFPSSCTRPTGLSSPQPSLFAVRSGTASARSSLR